MVFSRRVAAYWRNALGRSRCVYLSAKVGVAIFSSYAIEDADGVGRLYDGAVSSMDNGYGGCSHRADKTVGNRIQRAQPGSPPALRKASSRSLKPCFSCSISFCLAAIFASFSLMSLRVYCSVMAFCGSE